MSKKFLVVFLLVFLLFFLSLSINNVFAMVILPSLDITTDTTWTAAGNPYAYNQEINILNGAKLTIEAGVEVDLGSWSMNIINGELITSGTEGSEPAIKNGVIIVRPAGKLSLHGAIIENGGYYESNFYCDNYDTFENCYTEEYYDGAIIAQGGEINIENSIITSNEIGLEAEAGSNIINIHNSKIYNNNHYGVINDGDTAINATNNWWGDDSGPYHPTLNPFGMGDKIKGNVLFNPWLTQEKKKNPVIIIPGIMGSWYSVEKGWQLDPILHTYDNLYKALVENGGYVPEETLFTFPHEWRQDNAINAYQLKQKIDEIKNQTDAEKVDIIAHSMGGLVARYYVESDYYGNDIDRIVFLGTPHKGAPKSYLMWEGASGLYSTQEQVIKLYFTLEAHARGYETLFDYIQSSVLSVKQLLPVYPYLQDIEEISFREYDQENYPNNYPYNEFLEDLNSTSKLDKFFSSGVKIFNITGNTGDDTINAVRVSSGEPYLPMWEHGFAEETIKLTGDGTVPAVSSSLFIPTEILGADHTGLPTKAQKQIIDYLTGEMPINEITLYPEPKEALAVSVFSPVDFMIISPSGKKLGKDFSTESEINETENGFYSGFTSETEFAVIVNPEEGEYRIELEGVSGGGSYQVIASYFDNNSEIERTFSGSIQNGENHNFNINYLDGEEPISELIPIDNTPPSISVVTPEESSQYLHNSLLNIDYEVTDDLSGIEKIILKLDSQEISTTSLDLFSYDLGEHILEVVGVDRAGNIATSSVKFKIAVNLESAIADIERARQLGWINKEFVKNILIIEMKIIQNRLELFQQEKEVIEKNRERINSHTQINSEIKKKLLKNIDEQLKRIDQRKDEFIIMSLNGFIKTLNLFNKLGFISQQGYAIILNNANYLKINL